MSSWPLVQLGDVFDIARGGSPRPIDAYITDDPDGVNWIMIGDAPEGSKYITGTKKRIRKEGAKRSRTVGPGDFLLTNSMSFGRPYILQTSGCIHDGWLVLTRRKENLDSDFFYHLLGSRTMYSLFEQRAAGATVKNLNIDLVKSVRVPLPPLTEQRRIADILDRADALRAKRRAAFSRTHELAEAVFVETFGQLERALSRWPMRRFEEVCDTRLGKMLDQKRQVGNHRRRYLRNANVQWFRFDLSDVFEMDFHESDRETFRLQQGDLIICEGGEPGRAAIWQGQIGECYFQKALHRARPRSAIAKAEYLLWVFWFLVKHGGLKDYVTSATIAHLTGEKLKLLPIPIPPLELQTEFTRRIGRIDNLRLAHQRSLSDLDALFASLQHRAFRGEL